jgi:hypothetical protein
VKVHCNCLVQLLLCLGARAARLARNVGGFGKSLEKPYPKSLKPVEKPTSHCLLHLSSRQSGSNPLKKGGTRGANLVRDRWQ